MGEAGVLPAPAIDQVPRRERHGIELERLGMGGGPDHRCILAAHCDPGDALQGAPCLQRIYDLWNDALSIVENDGIDVGREERFRVGGCRMAAEHDWHTGRELAHAARKRQHFVGLERVHAGDADEPRSRGPELVFEGTREAKIGDGDLMAARLQRRGDVLHAKRLDAEEGTEAEPIVPGNRAQEQDVHGRVQKRNMADPL